MKGRLARAAPYILLLAVAGALYAAALEIEHAGPSERIGPAFWPRAILGLLALVCVYEIAKSLVAARARSTGGMLQSLLDEVGAGEAGAAAPSVARVVFGIAATLAYALLVGVLGFFLATTAFLAAFIALGGYRRWSVVAACSLGGSFAMLALFMKVVYVSLPLGVGPFRMLSIGLLQALGVR